MRQGTPGRGRRGWNSHNNQWCMGMCCPLKSRMMLRTQRCIRRSAGMCLSGCDGLGQFCRDVVYHKTGLKFVNIRWLVLVSFDPCEVGLSSLIG